MRVRSAHRVLIDNLTDWKKDNMPKLNTRVYGYAGNGEVRFEGIYRGKRKDCEGFTVRVYKRIELDDGTIYETILPVYRVA